MQGFFGCKFLLPAILPLTLAACGESSIDNSETGASQAASGVFEVVARNARSIGATVQTVGEEAVVVTYQGGPQGYFSCTTKGQAAYFQSGSTLDARTNVVSDKNRLKTDTVYIATTTTPDGRISVAFSDKERGVLPDGGYCRSTQKLESTLTQPR